MKTVVTPKDDQRVVGVRTVLQGVQHNADAVVDKRHRGQVGVGQAALFAGTHHLGVGRRDGVIVDAQKILRQIVEIALRIVRQRDLVRLVLGKPLGRHEERDVRTEEADRHKERLIELLLESLGGVVGELDIGHLGVLFRVGAPIPGTAPARRPAHWPFRPRTAFAAQRTVNVTDQAAIEIMVKNLAAGQCRVAVFLKIPLKRGHVLKGRQLLVARPEFVAPVRGRRHARHHTGPRCRTYRHGAMRIQKIAPALGQCIHVRRARLRMPAHEPHPIIEIINGDE